MTPSRASPIAPQAMSTTQLVRGRLGGAGNGQKPFCSSRGRGHMKARATKATSTAAAAHENSHVGTGRSARPDSPWAAAAEGQDSTSPT